MLLKRCCRADDVVTRYGGDEFAVIFWDAEEPRVAGSKHPEEPRALASRFQDAIGAHQFTCLGAAAPGPVTISGGLACYPWNGRDRASLLTAADQALLCAKRTGKNQIALAGEPFQAETTSDH
jgi:diguanylate cyclase (GGDEF)-like protein